METLWPSDYLLKPHVGAAKRKNEGYMWDSYQGRPTRGYRAEPGYTARLLGISLHSFFVQLRPFQTEILNCMNFSGEFGRTLQIFSTSRAIKAVQMLLHRSKVIKCPYCTVPENRTAFPLPSCPGQAGPKRLFQSRRWVRSKSHNGRNHW